ncbi:MAG: NUDIX domain-containing protein [Bacteroidales bacterium]|nr:NUDIX domain-containing protein [Bacteroidales bacterium]NLO67752.1 NUDIX hydrolase [Bacteroidales bacterium]
MMSTFYPNEERQLIAVDCVILGYHHQELKLLLIKRQMEPGIGMWSLMGGFPRREESLDDAANRVLFQLTGLDGVYMEQLYAYGEVNRDPGERVVSVAYYALINIGDDDQNLTGLHDACWCPLSQLPELVFDHRIMVDKALARLRRKARIQPIGFELLPEKFSLPQLQGLYEAIYQKELDKRNFRKKILSMDLLDKLEEKDKTSSKKGAFLYRFNQEKYNELLAKGFYFSVDV